MRREDVSRDKKRLILTTVIVVLFFIMIALVILIILNFNSASVNNEGNNEETIQETDNEHVVEQYGNTEELIANYQKKIDATENDEEKAILYSKRADEIIKFNEEEKDYSEQVLSDKIQVYNINKTIGNVIEIINYAYSIDRLDTAKQYEKILDDMVKENDEN